MPLGTVADIPRKWNKGEDVTFPYEVESSLAPSGIAGWTFLKTIKDKDVGWTFAVTLNGVVTDATNRLLEFVLPTATSQTIPTGTNVLDVWRTNAGLNWTLGKGSATVEANRRYA